MASNFFVTHAASAQNNLSGVVRSLPPEIRNQIKDHVESTPLQVPKRRAKGNMPRDPSIPPRNGSCPLLKLSIEERRHILQEFLPSRDRIIQPSNKGNPKSRTCDLMVLNKQLCSELSTILYEERTFAIHVYEGLFTGGIEFLNSGLQRLQYRDGFKSNSFKRFEEEEKLFGFQRLKRLHVVIHPSRDKASKTNRHDPLLTYFMLCTMLELLKKNGVSELNYLEIRFDGIDPADATPASNRNTIMRASQYWWNSDSRLPRQTSIHGVSNVELILSAFECLSKVHRVHIKLPRAMRKHKKTIKSVNRLIELLCHGQDTMNTCEHDLGHKLEVAREALDEFIFRTKFGNKAIRNPNIWIDLGEPMEESRFLLDSKEIDDMDEGEQLQRAIHASLVEHENRNKTIDKGKTRKEAVQSQERCLV